ncbi:MAG: HAD family hydrolase [Magnetococcales bacterium]|nr:HAD family hydrolase [Magnetococcales bacterium]
MRGVIFDVDGTLYDQKMLRRRMLADILRFYLLRPHQWSEPRMIFFFRRLREKLADAGHSPHEAIDGVARKFNISSQYVTSVVDQWVMQRPLRHLKSCRFPGVAEFIQALRDRMIPTAVFSDYPAREKLVALGLPDMPCIAAQDAEVNRLKPHPRGLEVAAEKLGLNPSEGLFIGDRHERDGLCAMKAGMPFLILGRGHPPTRPHFHSYWELLADLNRKESQS